MAFQNVMKCAVCSLRHVKFRFFVPLVRITRTVHRDCMKLDIMPRTAYFQKRDSDSTFTLSVLVQHEPLKVNKSFTFLRRIDNKISDLLSKVDMKICSYVEHRLRKEKWEYELPKVESMIYKNGRLLSSDIVCSSLFEERNVFSMKILGDSYDVVCNAPWVKNMTLPKKILTNSVIFPAKFEADYTDKEKSCFTWYRSAKMGASIKTNIIHVKDWVEVGKKFCYTVQDEDVGHYLKLVCIPLNATSTGPTFTVISSTPIVACRDNYNFVKTHILTKDKVDNSKIRILSYNLLAENYVCTKEARTLFDYCSPEVLQKEQRLTALAWEISGYNADLLCLQEVNSCIHNSYINGRLENEGYDGILCSKANEKEGTACYYDKKKFTLISSDRFTYGQEITVNPFLRDIYFYLQENKNMFAKFIELPHCLQLMVLQSTSRPDHLIVLGNVHFFSQPNADLIRLLQCITSFKIYEYVVDKLQKERPNDKISFILCGDFNSTPECSVNELVVNGYISSKHPIWSSAEKMGLSYKLPIKMASAFPDVKYTNYTRLFKGCLDYIYYQSESFEVSKTYPLPDEDELSAYVGLPSIHFPSDHLPLIADLQWKI